MQISTKGRHAVRIMTDLARNNAEFVSINEIASRQGITVKYLEKIMGMLAKKGLVVSMRGATGGYKLSRSADKFSVLEILEAVVESTKIANCTVHGDCARQDKCDTMKVWFKLSNLINDYLKTITLEDLIK